MARVLYTSRLEGVVRPGLIEAEELTAARRDLEHRGHTSVRFWSHPVLGDVEGGAPDDAFRRAPRPSFSPTSIGVLASLWVALPGTLALWAYPLGLMPAWLDTLPTSIVTAGSFLTTVVVQIVALQDLRRAVRYRQYGVASALLWTMRLGMPLIIPLLETWGVRIRAGRRGLEAAMRPYGWMRAVGLGQHHAVLRNEALDQLGSVDQRIEEHRTRLARAPSPADSVELALLLVLHRGDSVGARAALAGVPGPVSPLVDAVRALAQVLIEIEEQVPDRVRSVDAAARRFTEASNGLDEPWRPLFAAARARALARSGRVADATRSFRDALQLLWSDDIDVLDRAAADLRAARESEARR